MPTPAKREDTLQRILAWAVRRPDVQALILTGSSARQDNPADEWSDLDLIIAVNDPARFLASSEWLSEIAEVLVATLERAPQGQIVERRCVFQDGVDADFIVVPAGDPSALRAEPLPEILSRGARVLLDKANSFSTLPDALPAALVEPPTPAEFAELVNDFWFHAIWTSKKLRRGELWTAKSCCDGYMKRHLLSVLEWQGRAEEKETWYSGRFIERWVDAQTLAELEGVFAHYQAADVWRALENTLALFDRLARCVAQNHGYDYPAETAENVTAQVKIWQLEEQT